MAFRHPPNYLRIGVISLVVVLIVLLLGFTKKIPFTHGYRVKAQFTSAVSIRPNSPVRIAGVNVGKVTKIEATEGTDVAVLTLELSDAARPVHADATAKIRPRIFLEGNFFVDLSPGTPQAPELGDGDTIKVTQTATPVQLDQVLTSLQSDPRQDLKDLLNELSTALNSKPDAADDSDADPSARGQTAAESWNDAYEDTPAAFRGTAQVNDALLGSEPERDLRRLLVGTARTTGALVRSESALQDLISNFNATMAALASEQDNLRASIGQLGPTLQTANAALASLNAAFPATRAFAREILPGVRETAATIDATLPWIAQMRPFVSRAELGGLVHELAPATADLARLTASSIELLPKTTLVSRCATDVVLPTGDVVIHDEFDTGMENYKEAFYSLVGLSGESQNFDGNGQMVRFQTGGGAWPTAYGSPTASSGELFGHAYAPPLGTRPKMPSRKSPYKPDATCYKQQRPNLNGPAAALGPSDAAPGTSAAARAAGQRALRAAKTRRLAKLSSQLTPFGSARKAERP